MNIPLKMTHGVEDRDNSDAIDLRQLQDFFWRRWKLILAAAAAVMALAFLVLLTIAPRYTATAQVLLEPRKEKIFGADNILPELNLETGNVDSQLSVIQSINLLRRVVEKEKLTADAEFGQAASRRSAQSSPWPVHLGRRPADRPRNKPDGAIPPDVLRSIGRLRGALDVTRVNRTYVLAIAVTSEDPAKATRLANAVADAYVVDQLDARYDAAKRASTWLAERMEGLQDQLRQSEQAVAEFRKEHNLQATSSGDSKITISDQQLSDLNGKLIAARADTAEKRAKYEQAAQRHHPWRQFASHSRCRALDRHFSHCARSKPRSRARKPISPPIMATSIRWSSTRERSGATSSAPFPPRFNAFWSI